MAKKIALVMSGGGAKGAFEVGALSYFARIGVHFDCICSTSAGSLNAIKMAENDRFVHEALGAQWKRLRDKWDIFEQEAWSKEYVDLRKLDATGDITESLGPKGEDILDDWKYFLLDVATLGTMPLITWLNGDTTSIGIMAITSTLKENADFVAKQKSILNLNPQIDLLRPKAQGWTGRIFPLAPAVRVGKESDYVVYRDQLGRLNLTLFQSQVGEEVVLASFRQTSPNADWQLHDRVSLRGVKMSADAAISVYFDDVSVARLHVFSSNAVWMVGFARDRLTFEGHRFDNAKGASSVLCDADRNTHVFFRGGNDTVHHYYAGPSALGAQKGEWLREGLDAPVSRVESDPAAIEDLAGNLFLFAADSNRLHFRQRTGDGWTEWRLVANQETHFLKGRFKPLLNCRGDLVLYVLMTSATDADVGIYTSTLNVAAGVWSEWRMVSRSAPLKDFDVGMNADGRLEFFGVTLSNQVVHASEVANFGDISAWDSFPFDAATAPVKKQGLNLAKNDNGRLELFHSASDRLYHRWQTAGSFVDLEKVVQNKTQLRISMLCLDTGELLYCDEKGRILDRSGMPHSDFAKVYLNPIDAAVASASIPIAFPPAVVNGFTLVDGGVRENIPLRAAIDLNPDEIVVLHLNPPLTKMTQFRKEGLAGIAARVSEVMFDELEYGDVYAYGFQGKMVHVVPSSSVGDTLDVTPTRVPIVMDYGYMKAFDQYFAAGGTGTARERTYAQINAISNDLFEKRTGLMDLEKEVLRFYVAKISSSDDGDGVTPTGEAKALNREAVYQVRELKREIKALIEQRIQLAGEEALPREFARWYSQWETHPEYPVTVTPWDAFDNSFVTVPADTP